MSILRKISSCCKEVPTYFEFFPQGTSNCRICPAGYSCTNSSQSACSSGEYSLRGNDTCLTCPSGSQCPFPNLAPIPCVEGEHTDGLEGQTSCTACAEGSECPDPRYGKPLYIRADSRLAPSQWETSLRSNAISHWLGANLESALYMYHSHTGLNCEVVSWYGEINMLAAKWDNLTCFGCDFPVLYKGVLLWFFMMVSRICWKTPPHHLCSVKRIDWLRLITLASIF